jgi:hypothetical protein
MGPSKNFEISRIKFFKNKWLGLPIQFDISMVLEISVFEIPG